MIYMLSKNVRDINHFIQNLLFIATENSKYMFLSFDIEWGFKILLFLASFLDICNETHQIMTPIKPI